MWVCALCLQTSLQVTPPVGSSDLASVLRSHQSIAQREWCLTCLINWLAIWWPKLCLCALNLVAWLFHLYQGSQQVPQGCRPRGSGNSNWSNYFDDECPNLFGQWLSQLSTKLIPCDIMLLHYFFPLDHRPHFWSNLNSIGYHPNLERGIDLGVNKPSTEAWVLIPSHQLRDSDLDGWPDLNELTIVFILLFNKWTVYDSLFDPAQGILNFCSGAHVSHRDPWDLISWFNRLSLMGSCVFDSLGLQAFCPVAPPSLPPKVQTWLPPITLTSSMGWGKSEPCIV